MWIEELDMWKVRWDCLRHAEKKTVQRGVVMYLSIFNKPSLLTLKDNSLHKDGYTMRDQPIVGAAKVTAFCFNPCKCEHTLNLKICLNTIS